MGLDLSLACDCCNQSVNSFNYTYNVSSMWYAACPSDEKMVQIEGMTGEDAAKKLTDALEKLKAEPEKYKQMNPKNGWGSYDTFCKFISELISASNEYPTMKWRACR